MRRLIGLLFCTFCLAALAHTQEDGLSAEAYQQIKKAEDSLSLLAYAVINDTSAENRFGACRTMIPKLVTALKQPHSFQYPFDRLEKYVSIQYPPDSSFRIFTWQLYVDKDTYHFYGAIQRNAEELELFPLIDRSSQMEGNPEQAQLSADNWYGALYYNLRAVYPPDGAPYYLCFGFDGNGYYERRKLIDVLRFENGVPVFGAPVFVDETSGQTKHRVMLEYSAEVSIACNYDLVQEMIIFDHLVPFAVAYSDQAVHVPDGTYEAYDLGDDGRWYHIDQLANQILDEAPRTEPILDGAEKSLFGKQGGQ